MEGNWIFLSIAVGVRVVLDRNLVRELGVTPPYTFWSLVIQNQPFSNTLFWGLMPCGDPGWGLLMEPPGKE